MHIFVACTLAISIGVASTGSSVYIIFGVFDFSRAVVRTTTNHQMSDRYRSRPRNDVRFHDPDRDRGIREMTSDTEEPTKERQSSGRQIVHSKPFNKDVNEYRCSNEVGVRFLISTVARWLDRR